ncbi:MAG: hemerythrin family protein [Clostridiales bacterium]|nr:hemerythrin family protein [Clostridiales bacterium]
MRFLSSMITNVDLIDEQHRTLFNHIDMVESIGTTPIPKDKAVETIQFLGDYIVKHFHDEEELQKNSRYPRIKEHQKLHKWYIKEFQKLKNEYDKHGYSAHFAHILNESIIDWYSNHVLVEDIALGKHIGAQII